MRAGAPLVKPSDGPLSAAAFADGGQGRNHVRVGLTPNLGQGGDRDTGLRQNPGAERVRRLITETVKQNLVFTRHHGRQLEKIAHHHHLDAAERRIRAMNLTQAGIDAIERIGPDHGNLVDDQAAHLLDGAAPLLLRLQVRGVDHAERQPQQPMQGGAAKRHGGDAGRRGDNLVV